MAHPLHSLYSLFLELSNMAWPEFMQPYVDSFVQWVNSVLEYWDLEYLEVIILFL